MDHRTTGLQTTGPRTIQRRKGLKTTEYKVQGARFLFPVRREAAGERGSQHQWRRREGLEDEERTRVRGNEGTNERLDWTERTRRDGTRSPRTFSGTKGAVLGRLLE